jgi:serine phosphatase RsbU (regulator of sigma subunit)
MPRSHIETADLVPAWVARKSTVAFAWRNALQAASPRRVLSATNDLVLTSFGGSGYASAFFGLLDTHDGSFAYCSAGHPQPALVTAGEKPRLLRDPQLVLGVDQRARYGNDRASLAVGATLVMYTDGLIEARDPKGRQYGTERLLRAVRKAADEPVERLPEALFLDAFSFAEGTLVDDVAILALRRTEAPFQPVQERLALDVA